MTIFLIIIIFLMIFGGIEFYILIRKFKKYENLYQSIVNGQQVLRNNQSVLSADIKKLNNELQITKKGINKKEVVKRPLK
jgi:Trk-type K+ transport system membrane component